MSIESLLCLSSRMSSILIHIKSIESSNVNKTVPPTFLGGSAFSTYQRVDVVICCCLFLGFCSLGDFFPVIEWVCSISVSRVFFRGIKAWPRPWALSVPSSWDLKVRG